MSDNIPLYNTRDSVRADDEDPPQGHALVPGQLSGVQILFIVFSVVIGTGVFTNNGEVLAEAGSIALLSAVAVLGFVACAVGETVISLVRLFPARNPVYHYTRAFIDQDLAFILTLLYWYCYAAVFVIQMITAAELTSWWQPDNDLELGRKGGLMTYIFYGLAPLLLLSINMGGVPWFGKIETFLGGTKALMLLVFTFCLAAVATKRRESLTIKHPSKSFAADWVEAFFIVFPSIAYSYIGVESTLMAVYEGPRREDSDTATNNSNGGLLQLFNKVRASLNNPKGFFWAPRFTHWIVFFLYFIFTLAACFAVKPSEEDPGETLTLESLSSQDSTQKDTLSYLETKSLVIIAFHAAKWPHAFLSFVNVVLIFCVLSGANSALYIASRTLWGIGEEEKIKFLRLTWEETNVPVVAVFISAGAFISWFPGLVFLHDEAGELVPPANKVFDRSSQARDILSSTASQSCLIIWFFISLASYQFYRKCEANEESGDHLKRHIEDPDVYQAILDTVKKEHWRWISYRSKFAMLGCFFLFVLSSGTLWQTRSYEWEKIVSAYGAHFVVLLVYLGKKLQRRLTGKKRFTLFNSIGFTTIAVGDLMRKCQ